MEQNIGITPACVLNLMQRNKLRSAYAFFEDRHSLNMLDESVQEITNAMSPPLLRGLEVGLLEEYLGWLGFKLLVEDDMLFYMYLSFGDAYTIKVNLNLTSLVLQLRAGSFTNDLFANAATGLMGEITIQLNEGWQADFVKQLQQLVTNLKEALK
jgi:hypothetical protein